jgi:adenylate kinase
MKRRAFLTLTVAAVRAWPQKPAARRVFVFLGPPGAGKTTQSKILADRYRLPVIDAATLLKQSAQKSEVSKRLKVQVEGGELLGDRGLNDLFQARVRRGDCYNGFIVDGYPANKVQAEFMVAQLKDLTFPPPVIIHLQVSDEIARKRTQSRGRADDKSGRSDQRLLEYRAEEKAVLGFFSDSQVIHVDASPGEREVAAAIEKQLNARR